MERGRQGDRLDAITSRRDVLAVLADEDLTQAEVATELGVSRSTVTRAVGHLTDLGLLERSGSTYRTTTLGRLALDAYDRYRTRVEALFDASRFLQYIPRDAHFDPGILLDAQIDVAGPNRSVELGERVNETMKGAESIRGLGKTYAERESHSIFLRTLEESGTLSHVLSRDLYRYIRNREADLDLLEHEEYEYAVVDTLPYGLFVVDTGEGETMVLIAYDDAGTMKGVLRNSTDHAVSWAEQVIDAYEERGTEPPLERD
ncbi:MAG: helix-turn-helix transcriptional regulator [Halodesulfurarchaeum sp.]